VGGVDGHHDRFPGDGQHLEAGRRAVVTAVADQGGVQVAVGERGEQGIGLVFEHGQLDARAGPAEGAEQAGEAPVGQGVDQADGQAAGEQAGERRHRLAPAVGRLQRRPRVRQ
jgi:hypothetical protein